MADLKGFVENLGKEIGAAGPFGDQKSYKMQFSKELQVTFSDLLDGNVLLEGPIGHLPEQQTEDFLIYIGFANLFGEGTGEAVISLDNEGKLLYLDQRVKLANFGHFKDEVEMFVNYLELWQKKRADAASGKAVYRNGLLQPL